MATDIDTERLERLGHLAWDTSWRNHERCADDAGYGVRDGHAGPHAQCRHPDCQAVQRWARPMNDALRRLIDLKDDIRSAPMMHTVDAVLREQWGDRLAEWLRVYGKDLE